MKNKKLFAILTLVCFMFTLMPVAAFAAADYSLNDNTIKTNETVTVTLDGAEAGVSYFVYALDSNDKLYTSLKAGEAVGYKGIYALTDEIELSFAAPGNYDVLVAPATGALVDVFAGETYVSAGVLVDELNAAAATMDASTKTTVKVSAATNAYNIGFVIDADADTVGDEATTLDIVADKGFLYDGKVTVVLTDSNGDPIKKEAVKFTTNSGYITVNAIDDVTDKDGEQEIAVTASKAGNYKVYAKYANKTEELVVNVASANVASVTTVAEPKTPVALGTELDGYTGIAFEFVDGNGTILEDVAGYKVTVVEAPADSALLDIESTDLELTYDSSVNYAFVLADANDLGLTFDEEGKYTFKVTLANGSSATASVNVKEFGKPVSMKLIYLNDTVALDSRAIVKAVTLLDANYTAYTIYNAADGNVSDYTIEFAANGVAVESVAANGMIGTYSATEVEAKEVIGTTITAMAIVDELELVASAELTVVNSAASLKYVDTTADVAVNNKLEVNPVDAKGNVVSLTGLSSTTGEVYVYVLDAPENAVYDVDANAVAGDEITVDFTASAAGEYKLQLVVKTNTGKYLSSVDTIVVGGAVSTFDNIVVVSIGADKMIVNNETVALDVAPFIENNRTMLQFNVLHYFGFEVNWIPETTQVVAEGNGIKVVMTLNSKVATVNGQEVALDVAPTSINNRTVVPVGFLTGTFGINPTFIYGDAGLDSILFAK